jgi:hypothetical protein
MSRFERWTLHLSSLLVGGTGLVYAWMAYLARPADPYAVVNHPWQPMVQHLHVLVAPLLVFAAGLIWQRHVMQHWKKGVKGRRRSGLSLILTMVPMVASGYLIQTTTGEGWRQAWVVVHLVASGLWLVGYLAHQVSPAWAAWRRLQRRRRANVLTFVAGPSRSSLHGPARPADASPLARAAGERDRG